jgi:ferrochelatase
VAVLGIACLNMGGPDSPEAVEPFLRNLFADPDLIQLGWARPLQPVLARIIARRRAPHTRAAYAQIGGRSPIREESLAQARAVAEELSKGGVPAAAFVAMSYWHPFAHETAAAMQAAHITRAVLVPLYPHRSRSTTGSCLRSFGRAAAAVGMDTAAVDGYATAPGYLAALADRVAEALASVPGPERERAYVLFSAHGLPESYIRRGDPYLDDVRATVAAVSRKLDLGGRSQLAFQSRVGRQRWLGPSTEAALVALARAGHKAVVVVPVSFTGEHVETLQELDLAYRQRAVDRGVERFARARTVGCHPAFIAGLAELVRDAARARGWL